MKNLKIGMRLGVSFSCIVILIVLMTLYEVSNQIIQIATATEEQTATTNEVTMNIQQISDVVVQTSRGAEETASAASQLAQRAQEMERLVGLFKLV